MLIEDVACPVDKLGDMMIDLITMFKVSQCQTTALLGPCQLYHLHPWRANYLTSEVLCACD